MLSLYGVAILMCLMHVVVAFCNHVTKHVLLVAVMATSMIRMLSLSGVTVSASKTHVAIICCSCDMSTSMTNVDDICCSHVDEPDPDQSIEERAVRWKLRSLDSNNNKVLYMYILIH